VLGVYASAVHARWIDTRGKVLVHALAVASEPEIFWTGEGAEAIVSRIPMEPAVGKLNAAGSRFNGPSGRTLDDRYLAPLGLARSDAWCCDLLPESRLNNDQVIALDRCYKPLVESDLLPEVTIPRVPSRFADSDRQTAILNELISSRAPILITLGDIPLRDFAQPLGLKQSRLSEFGVTPKNYGQLHEVRLGGTVVQLLPLAHPRQAGRLGKSSSKWSLLHNDWVVKNETGESDLSSSISHETFAQRFGPRRVP
jgi:hypothetical protein